jgi:NAD-dependent DNA ligase
MNKVIELFKQHGINVLISLTESDLEDILRFCNNAYFNNTPVLNDSQYDIINEFMEKKYPKNNVLKKVGSLITDTTKQKIKLPYQMWSMDKIKPDTNELEKFKKKYKGPYVISSKLDGVSGLYSTENGEHKLYTRGDGVIGQNITNLLNYLNLPKIRNIVVRGELIIRKNIFEEKYKSSFSNPRNLSSGIINSKTIDDKIIDIDFVVYELIKPIMVPNLQFKYLQEKGFNVAQNLIVYQENLTNTLLSNILVDWRTSYKYEIDGIIVCNDTIVERLNSNPEHAFAFKMVLNDQIAEAKVLDVIWTPSKNGYLKPRVRIEPIHLSGVVIEYATGFNGSFIKTNKIGVGSVISIIRSGDVIPFIQSVIIPADEPKMPDAKYHWNDTLVDIILDNFEDNLEVKEKNIALFFSILNVDGLAIGNVKKIMKTGYDSVPKILKMTKKDFEKVDGFKDKMVEKIYNGINEKIKEASLIDIIIGSNLIGRGLGYRKITPILEKYPDILTSSFSDDDKIEMLKTISGIGEENANAFVMNICSFLHFIKECGLEHKLENIRSIMSDVRMVETTNHILSGKKIVMTKIRDADVIKKIKDFGGIFEDNMSKTTFALIVKSNNDTSTKIDYAVKNNVPIYTLDEFVSKYLQ